MPRRPRAAIGLAVAIVVAAVAACGTAPAGEPDVSRTPAVSGPSATPTPDPATRPVPGHEVFGFLPYWEIDDGIAAHLRTTDLTTIALFSVTITASGAIDTKQTGYRRMTGEVGARVIREAREHGVRVELVFTSFGLERNRGLFEDVELQDAAIGALVDLVGRLELDGVDVDVESLDPVLVPAYGAFVGRLRDAVVVADANDRVSVATSAGLLGAAMAAAAVDAGADRIFLMGYDYRTAGSEPGASAPLERRDGAEKDLAWSLDVYEALGVPVERTLLGLPLYGMSWPVAGPELGAPATGSGKAWVPRRNLAVLRDPLIVPIRDEIEAVELYAIASDDGLAWRAIYVDSPATLAPKLALANARGLAGAGFWAIGFERGLPGYAELIARFAAGEPLE